MVIPTVTIRFIFSLSWQFALTEKNYYLCRRYLEQIIVILSDYTFLFFIFNYKDKWISQLPTLRHKATSLLRSTHTIDRGRLSYTYLYTDGFQYSTYQNPSIH